MWAYCLNEMGNLVTKDSLKTEVLNAFFALFFTTSSGLGILETMGKGWSKEYVPLVEEDPVRKKNSYSC